ncbi:MAG: hypothetical protein PVF77_00600 [Anaerolineae bacterium]
MTWNSRIAAPARTLGRGREVTKAHDEPAQMAEMSIPQADSRQSLSHILWMGGSPCSGKSSIARILAGEYNLHTYHCDEAFAEHRQQVTASQQPMLHKWTHTSWDELWMQPHEILVAEAIACYREHFQLVVKDLLALPDSEPILVEGTCLLPGSVDEVLSSRDRAIWVIPTEAFQKAHYRDRGAWVEGILSECTKPDQAFQNWMDRDAAFAGWVARTANKLDLRPIQVDGRRTIAQNARLIAGLLPL